MVALTVDDGYFSRNEILDVLIEAGVHATFFIIGRVLVSDADFVRRAVSENRKLYFMDIGVRNALVNDFRPISLRPDKGGLFENLVISELEKTSKNHGLKINKYFYREYGGKEVDLVIEDYRKNYWVFEIKSKRGYGGDIFPIQNKYSNINSENFYQELVRLMDSIKASMNK